jgi:hypothetical protein
MWVSIQSALTPARFWIASGPGERLFRLYLVNWPIPHEERFAWLRPDCADRIRPFAFFALMGGATFFASASAGFVSVVI